MKKVLVIDDSALMRRAISDIINQDDKLTVAGTANNGFSALEHLDAGERFDVLLIDIKMPKMDGVQLLREMEAKHIRIPSIVVSSIASETGVETIEALSLGAMDFVKKPISSIGENFAEFRMELLEKIYIATGLDVVKSSFHAKPEPKPAVSFSTPVPRRPRKTIKSSKLVVIASSTGGPKALQSVVPFFPAGFPYPIVVIQHMPAGFTNSLAQRLDEMSPLHVKEASDGEELKAGNVYIAMGGKQCELVHRPGGGCVFSENDKPPRGGLRPCADIFFESLVESSYEEIITAVLTGMGADGCSGISLIRNTHQVKCVAQSADTCVVYGMPRAVVEAGVADKVVPLESVTEMLVRESGVK